MMSPVDRGWGGSVRIEKVVCCPDPVADGKPCLLAVAGMVFGSQPFGALHR
jgi:hypothetical protein